MSDQKKSSNRTGRTALKDFVTVAFAEDLDLARQHKEMLEENGISAVVKQPENSDSTQMGIAVQVGEDDLDEAHSLIASQASFEEFFDVFFQGDGVWPADGSEEDEYE